MLCMTDIKNIYFLLGGTEHKYEHGMWFPFSFGIIIVVSVF